MVELDISFGKNRTDKNWKIEYLTWGEFVDKLKKVRHTKETMAEYDRMDNFSRGRIKDGPAFVGGFILGGRRKKVNMESRSLITLDADYADKDFAFNVELILGGKAYAIYSTHSHRDDKPRYRLIVPLSRPVGLDEYAAISRKVASMIGLEQFDKTTFSVHRLMYMPSCSADAEPVLEIGEGEILTPADILSEYIDWTDITSWPRHKEEHISIGSMKVQDPRSKRYIIGCFNRTYTIEAAIEEFLAEEYTQGNMPNRYTYTKGTSANGLEVYPEQELAYSHQDSDPIADGRTYNAFDIIRVHRFGHLDEDYVEGSKAIPPSVTAMEHWASTLPDVKKLIMEEKQSDYQDLLDTFEVDDAEEDESDWESKLELHHKTGEVLSTSKNVELILSHGDFKGILAYDSFGNTEVIRGDLPWRKRERIRQTFEPWLGDDDSLLRHYLSIKYSIKGSGMILDAFKAVCQRNKFHPIKEYIESTKWDGVPRVETLFIEFLGAEDTPYTRQVTRKALLAAVTRLYEPGAKFDEMIVIVGPQGAGKSTLLAKLGRKWFSDSLRNFENKEAGEHLQAGWIFEIGELSAMKKAQLEEVKAFLSKTEDRYRVAYDRTVSDFPRKCVFFGTTNTKEFLQDKTGNRRFWPVEVSPLRATLSHWEHMDDAYVAQVWAEVLTYFNDCEGLKLDYEIGLEAEEQQSKYMEIDSLEGIIQEWLEEPLENWDDPEAEPAYRSRVCVTQIAVECFQHPRKDVPKPVENDIRRIMRKMEGWEESDKKLRVPGYGVQRVFERVLD